MDWLDVFKLFLAFSSSIFIFFIKTWHSKKEEIKAKEESIWRMLKVKIRRLEQDLIHFDSVISAYENGGHAGFSHCLDSSTKRVIQRLSELQPQNTYIYSKYESAHTQVSVHIDSLCHIVHALITTAKINEKKAKSAIISQMHTLKESAVEMGDASCNIMDSIKKSNIKKPIYDDQTISELKDSMSNLKTSVQIEANNF
jgi:hypothetical protein